MSNCTFTGFTEQNLKGNKFISKTYGGDGVNDLYVLPIMKSFNIGGNNCVAKMVNDSGDNLGHLIAGNYNTIPSAVPSKITLMNKRNNGYSFITQDGFYDNDPTVERISDSYTFDSDVSIINDGNSNASTNENSSSTHVSESESKTETDTADGFGSSSSSISSNGTKVSSSDSSKSLGTSNENTSGFTLKLWWVYLLILYFVFAFFMFKSKKTVV